MATRNPRALVAYVLHRYDWSESSLILDVFTRAEGRLAVAAKGAKRPYSQLRAVLLPFQRIHLTLGRIGDGEVQNLRGAEWAGGAAMLTGAALFSGFYLNELLMKLVARHDPHPQLFDVYAETLPALVDARTAEAALRAFELSLLREIGVLPDLGLITSTQQRVQPDARYGLLGDAGLVAPADGVPDLPGSTWIALQEALQHGSLEALRGVCAAALPELKAVLRVQLHYHLGTAVLLTRRAMLDAQRLER